MTTINSPHAVSLLVNRWRRRPLISAVKEELVRQAVAKIGDKHEEFHIRAQVYGMADSTIYAHADAADAHNIDAAPVAGGKFLDWLNNGGWDVILKIVTALLPLLLGMLAKDKEIADSLPEE